MAETGCTYIGLFHKGRIYGTGQFVAGDGKRAREALFHHGRVYDVKTGKVLFKDKQNIVGNVKKEIGAHLKGRGI